MRRTVSIVTPFFNEEGGIEGFYEALIGIFLNVPNLDFEVVCVDDGSSDMTLSSLIDLTKRDSRFHVIELSRNFGKEAALTAGMDAATGDAVIPFDADLQDPPELIPRLIYEWSGGADVVLARRVDRSSDGFLKRTTAKLFYSLHNYLSPVKIPHNVGDFRLVDRVVVDALKRLPERQRFMKGLFAWVGFRTVVVDYSRMPRLTGTTKFTGWRLWNFALDGITSFSSVPLRIWTYVGLLGAVLSFGYGSFILLYTLMEGISVPGYASLLVIILFMGSLQLISVGILGEYLGRLYVETKQRPLYVVRKKFEAKDEG